VPSGSRPDFLAKRVHRIKSSLVNRAWQAMVAGGVVGPGDSVAKRFGAFGEGSLLGFPPGVFYNEKYIQIGSQTMIGPYVSITAGMAPGQEMVTDPVVRIGDRNIIGRGSHIIGHFSIDIGDDIQTGPNVYITDQNHVYEDPSEPIGRQWPVESAVRVGSGSWLGTGVIVLPGADIGEHVVIGAGSVVTGEIPDYSVAVGIPAKVVKVYSETSGWMRVGDGPVILPKGESRGA
jgi:serine acetyltransferase